MKRAGLAILTAALLAGCLPPSAPASPTGTASPTITPDFDRYIGTYRAPGGQTWVTNASGHLLNLSDSAFRQMYASTVPDRFTVGPAFGVAAPTQATITFHVAGGRADRMTITPRHGASIIATRATFREAEVRIPGHGATLAGTITEPDRPGLHPGIVIIHGSEPGERFDYGIWVGFYANLGFTVLAYDKRGHGQSTGTYPGEYASVDALNTYADDASVALRFLAAWPGVDPHRVGFYGGSQGGWIVPLAMAQDNAPAAFAVVASGPAVTVDQQGAWADMTSGGGIASPGSASNLDAAVRAVVSTGYDPGPVLVKVMQPMLWLNGATDRQVPTRVNTEILQSLHKPGWDVVVLPGVDHGLFENPGGLESDEAKATRLAPVWPLIASWLARTAGG